MKNYANFENLNTTERAARFVVSFAVIVGTLYSPMVGSTLYAVINLLAIGLAATAIIGWDPAKALTFGKKSELPAKHNYHGNHHA